MKGTAQTDVGGQSLRLAQFVFEASRYFQDEGYLTGRFWSISLWADDDGKIYVL